MRRMLGRDLSFLLHSMPPPATSPSEPGGGGVSRTPTTAWARRTTTECAGRRTSRQTRTWPQSQTGLYSSKPQSEQTKGIRRQRCAGTGLAQVPRAKAMRCSVCPFPWGNYCPSPVGQFRALTEQTQEETCGTSVRHKRQTRPANAHGCTTA